MQNKRTYIILASLVITIGIFLVVYFNNNDNPSDVDKFYLDDVYYKDGKYVDTNSDEIKTLINDKKTFLLFVYNNYCSLPIPCNDIFEEIMKKHHIDVLQMTFENFKNLELYNQIQYAPTFIIIKEGIVVDYLKADDDSHLDYYQNANAFDRWLSKYLLYK